MGLPMFKEPGESSPQRVAEKVERAAASSRSTIRRERTVRDFETRHRLGERNENQVPDGSRTGFFPETRPRTRIRTRTPGPEEDASEEESRSNGGRRWATMLSSVRHGDEEGFHNPMRRQEEVLRTVIQSRRPTQRMRMPRSPRASALRFEVAPTSRSSASPERLAEEEVLLARPYMPSPPYSFSDNTATGLRLRDGPIDNVPAEPTPGFAPARGVHHDNEELEPATRGSAPRHHTPPGEPSWTASYPPLRRVSHLSPRPESHLSGYGGGLGDRRRSVSSSSSDGEQDTWETLLTTMEPDTQLPSTNSSFTSASASQSTHQPRNPLQSQGTSFASATTPTEHLSSRPTSPTWPYSSPAEMDMNIHSPQYSCLSEESRASMRNMLVTIQSSRQFRVNNPVTITVEVSPGYDRSLAMANQRHRAHAIRAVAEHRQQADENRILSNHFNTLRMMDDLRSSNAARSRDVPGNEIPSWQRPNQVATDHRQQHAVHDLLRTMDLQTQQMAHVMQEIDDARNNRRQDTVSSPGRTFAQVATDFGFSGHQRQQQQRQQHGDTTTDVESDLASMQRVIERMARREDIPDQWWAAAGLARTITENQ